MTEFDWNTERDNKTRKINRYITLVSNDISQYEKLFDNFYPKTPDNIILYHISLQNIDILRLIFKKSRVYHKKSYVLAAIMKDNVDIFTLTFNNLGTRFYVETFFQYALARGKINVIRWFIEGNALWKLESRCIDYIFCTTNEARTMIMDYLNLNCVTVDNKTIVTQSTDNKMGIEIDFKLLKCKDLVAAKYIIDNNLSQIPQYFPAFSFVISNYIDDVDLSMDEIKSMRPEYIELLKWRTSIHKKCDDVINVMHTVANFDHKLLNAIYDDVLNAVPDTQITVSNPHLYKFLYNNSCDVTWDGDVSCDHIDEFLLWFYQIFPDDEKWTTTFTPLFMLQKNANYIFKLKLNNYSENDNQIDDYYVEANVDNMQVLWDRGYPINDWCAVFEDKALKCKFDEVKWVYNTATNCGIYIECDTKKFSISASLDRPQIFIEWMMSHFNFTERDRMETVCVAIYRGHIDVLEWYLQYENDDVLKRILEHMIVITHIVFASDEVKELFDPEYISYANNKNEEYKIEHSIV